MEPGTQQGKGQEQEKTLSGEKKKRKTFNVQKV
jgi:hypothetical protein